MIADLTSFAQTSGLMTASIHSFAQTVGLIAGIIIAFTVIGRFAWGLFKFGRSLNRGLDWLEEIYQEFKPNHGKSLKDVIERLDRNVTCNSRNIEIVYSAVLKALPTEAVVDLEPFGLEHPEPVVE